jgi:formylglycine-generating enzyme required for sulfatase activity
MRCRSWLRWTTTLAVAATAFWVGCSEEEPVDVDQTPPTVVFVNPDVGHGLKIAPIVIRDSVTVAVDAQDASGIERVEFWVTLHADTTSRKLGESTTPSAPGPGQSGSGLYKYFWSTTALPSGSTGSLWAAAYDNLGNLGRTGQPVSIQILGATNPPPNPDFTISPNSGKVTVEFEFDPRLTTDEQEKDLSKIKVRWAFDYDPQNPVWDVDTTDIKADAGELQHNTYSTPKTYTIALQAWNRYCAQGSEIVTRDLTVIPEFGEPRPQQPTVQIPAGTYPIGVTVKPGGNSGLYGENELVSNDLQVILSTKLFIDMYEVTNAHYVHYLDSVLTVGDIQFDPTSEAVALTSTGELLITLDPDLTRIIYVDEESGFDVDPPSLNLPVTGVTWLGAKSYCSAYGLRLPTEYEWEIAARAGRIATTLDNGVVYPWTPDNQITGAYANFRDSGDPYEDRNNLRAETPVASYSNIDELMGSWPHENAVGPFGTYDQAGNVAEWVDDWYVPGIYNTMRAKYETTGRWPTDPQSPKEAESPTHTRVIRGGSFFETAPFLRVTRREARDPLVGSATVGFRAIYTEFIP